MRGYMQPGASHQRQRIVADVPMAAARRCTGGPVPRKDEPTATTSGKRRPVGRVRLGCSRPQRSTVPAKSPVPHTRGRDHSPQKQPAPSYRERPCCRMR
jgi:hypothetical protein